MSRKCGHEVGTYLGGIRTVEDIRQRCRMDPETGCWHWGMSMSRGRPRVRFVGPDGQSKSMNGRRAVVTLRDGAYPHPRKCVFEAAGCWSDDCVNPDHSRIGTTREHKRWLMASGKLLLSPSARAAMREAARTKRSKLTVQQVLEIRASSELQRVLAERYGVTKSCIGGIKRGVSWSDHIQEASVFTFRPELLKEAA